MQPTAVFRRAFLFLHLDLLVPLKRQYRFLDSFALGIGLIVALVVVLAIYQALVGPNTVTIDLSKFYEKWGNEPIFPAIYVFLAWRLLAMLARAWQVGSDDNQLKTDDVTKE